MDLSLVVPGDRVLLALPLHYEENWDTRGGTQELLMRTFPTVSFAALFGEQLKVPSVLFVYRPSPMSSPTSGLMCEQYLQANGEPALTLKPEGWTQ